MRRGVWLAMAILVLLLAVSVATQFWLLPTEVRKAVEEYPVLEPLAAPGILWEIAAIACWQAVGLIGLRVVALVRDRRFSASAYGWLWAMMGFLIAFIVLVAGAFIGLQASGFWSPVLGFMLVAAGLVGVIGVTFLAIFLATMRQDSGSSSTAVQADE